MTTQGPHNERRLLPFGEKPILAMGAVGLVVLLVVGVLSGFAMFRYRDAADWQAHSNAVLADARALYVAVIEAESNMRAYVNSREPSFMRAAKASEEQTHNLVKALRERVVDNEFQVQKVDELVRFIDHRFALIDELLVLASGGRDAEIKALFRTGRGPAATADVREAMRAFETTETALLDERSALRQQEFQRTQTLIIVTAGLAFLFLLTAMMLLARQLRYRKDAEKLARKAQAEALEASKAKSVFLARMSHEIRTPMNGILGMAELALRHPMDQAQQRNLEIIHQSASSLLAIINDILDLSKVESGRLEIQKVDFSLGNVLEDVRASFDHAARAKNLNIVLIRGADLGDGFRGDPHRLRQVLVNLVGNAVKFAERGEVIVRAARDGGALRFRVEDRGPGISEKTQAQLFTPFEQGEADVARRHGGTGLGLSICKELVELMGGSIGVESRLGEGSTFWFTLPLEAAVLSTKAPAPVLSSIVQSRTARVLVVEDNPVNQLVMSGMLEKLGHRFELAGDGEQAIKLLEQDPGFDLILMDCQMPVLDGYRATEIIRSRPSLPGHLPILAVSANALQEEMDRCLQVGMNDFVPKPLRIDELAGKINEWTGKSVATARSKKVRKQDDRMVLNRTTLETLEGVGGGGHEGRAFVTEMLRLYEKSYAEALLSLRQGFEAWTLGQMRKDAHKLKSSCGAVGAERLADICRAIEQFPETQAQGNMLRLIEQLAEEHGLVRAEVEMYLKEAKAA